MILAAKNAGVETCWVNFFDPAELAKDLGLPENEEILMVMPIGYAGEKAKPSVNHTTRKALSETVAFI